MIILYIIQYYPIILSSSIFLTCYTVGLETHLPNEVTLLLMSRVSGFLLQNAKNSFHLIKFCFTRLSEFELNCRSSETYWQERISLQIIFFLRIFRKIVASFTTFFKKKVKHVFIIFIIFLDKIQLCRFWVSRSEQNLWNCFQSLIFNIC